MRVHIALDWSPRRAPEPAAPLALDMVLVVDATSSMRPAMLNMRNGLTALVDAAVASSAGDLRTGLVLVRDRQVDVLVDLSPTVAAVRSRVAGYVAAMVGSGNPEAWDEALETVLERRRQRDRPPGRQARDFQGTFRATARRLLVLITDAPPAGFDESFDPADAARARAMAQRAAALGVRVASVFVPTGAASALGGDYAGQWALLRELAETTGGPFLETDPRAASLPSLLPTIVRARG